MIIILNKLTFFQLFLIEILEYSLKTFDEGKELLARLKEVSHHAESFGNYASNSSCYSIEHLLEHLNEKRRHLEELWRNRKQKLEQCIQICYLKEEIQKVKI